MPLRRPAERRTRGDPWRTLPGELGFNIPPWWWPVPWLALAALAGLPLGVLLRP